ncbi:MAG: hypothetical protein H0Z28_11400 [Archaeoglobus sp.]|nr:hypothetical protein [Archaeoglobus sp.]
MVNVFRLRNAANLISIVIASYLVATLSAISAYSLFKSLGFSGRAADLAGFIVHYITIFVSACLLLKFAAEWGHITFKAPKKIVFIALPLLIFSLFIFSLGKTIMIFPIDISLIMLAFVLAFRLTKF